MTLEQLRSAIKGGSIDTVLLVICDMQGRLQGKRLTAHHFLEHVVEDGAEVCNYLLAVDVDMETVEGYAISSWERGYGDFHLVPDLESIRPIPWHEKTALVMADCRWEDGSDVVESPRQILRRQLDRLAERRWVAQVGTELEFMLFETSYEEAWRRAYRDIVPANQYNVDYSILGTSRVEPVIGRIRRAMEAAEMVVENSKGECNYGQHEINFHYGPALGICDEHTIYKTGAKEIAAQEGRSITFMAKFNELEGSSCHVHISLARQDGTPLFGDDPVLFSRFLAGQLAGLRDLTLFFAPYVNSYKRFVPGSFAPTAIAWGEDNRTCSMRALGHGKGRRVEARMAGADVNPYLAVAALIAAGLDGIDRELDLEPPVEGNAYAGDAPRLPHTLRDARDAFAASDIAREAFGQEVVDHYLNNARIEFETFEAAVTDWERVRGFERL